MKFPIILVVPWLKVAGMAIFPFIFVQHASFKRDEQLLRHEKIHLRQELELLIIPFYLIYLINYLVNRTRYADHNTAYRNIVFEREAYANEADINYLQQRKIWAWINFVYPFGL